MLNILTGINESKKCECKRCNLSEKHYVSNPATCICENWKYFASIMHDSAIMCDIIIDPYNEDAAAKS